MKKNTYNTFNKLNYSTLINKCSQEYLNSKNINKIKVMFTNMCVSDIHIEICDIIYKYIEQDKDLSNYIEYYNIDTMFLEKMLKISVFYNESLINSMKIKIKNI